MSETGRKMDVEDVLSSIRRLVSEEAREDQSALEANDASVENIDQLIDSEPEKLVLTPSLRVPEDEKPVPPTSEIERRIADIENRVNTEAAALPGAGPQGSVDNDPAAMISALNLSMRDFQPEQPVETANDADAPVAIEALPEEVADAKLAEPSEVVELTEEPKQDPGFDPTPDTSEELAKPFQIQAVDAGTDFPGDGPFQRNFDTEVPPAPIFTNMEPEVDPTGAFEPEYELAEAPEAEMADMEAEEIEAGEFEEAAGWIEEPTLRQEPPLRAPIIDRASDKLDSDTSTTSAVDQSVEPPVSPVSMDERINFAADDGSLIDEDMLREIVSEMVRSELQGELGDRITRNVRKLVRREIHRALASRDFE